MVDIVKFREKGKQLVSEASKLEEDKKYEESLKLFEKAIVNFGFVLENDNNPYSKETLKKYVRDLEDKIEYLKKLIERDSKKEQIKEGGK